MPGHLRDSFAVLSQEHGNSFFQSVHKPNVKCLKSGTVFFFISSFPVLVTVCHLCLMVYISDIMSLRKKIRIASVCGTMKICTWADACYIKVYSWHFRVQRSKDTNSKISFLISEVNFNIFLNFKSEEIFSPIPTGVKTLNWIFVLSSFRYLT